MSNFPAVLDPASRAKLVNILGMLASNFDGERASAGLLASRLLKDRGLLWNDVILPAAGLVAEPSENNACLDLDMCLRHSALLTAWEQGFCVSLTTVHRPSPKQIAVLHRIAGTLRARGCK